MGSNLGAYFRTRRLDAGLSLGELARLAGYRNVSKGSNRIARFERGGAVHEELLASLAEALGIGPAAVEGLVEQDRQEYLRAWQAWADEAVPMRLVVKYLPAVFGTVELPEGVKTPQEAERYACEYARRQGRAVCLAVSRRLSVWIDREGEVEARTEAMPGRPNVPIMRFRGNKRGFLWGFGGRESNPGRP